MEALLITAIAMDKNQVKFSLVDLPDIPGIAAKIFGPLAQEGVNVDMIIQSEASDKFNDISFTVPKSDYKKALTVLNTIQSTIKAKDIIIDEDVAKISIVGVGMKSHVGVAAKMFEILSKNKINIEMISTSEIKVSCMIDNKDLNKAAEALHKGFGLGK